tara:strand:- start:112 stop:258 length:147 start_codon:yes stop_codon:yes gene_type:complete
MYFPNIPQGGWTDSNYVRDAFGIEYFKEDRINEVYYLNMLLNTISIQT